MKQHLPLSEDVVFDRSLPAELLQSYVRLLTRAWDGQRLRTVKLTFDELRVLWGNARLLSGAMAFRYLRSLRDRGLIEYPAERDGHYRISFPRAVDLTLKNESQSGLTLKNESQSGLTLKNESQGGLTLKNESQENPLTLKNESQGTSIVETESGAEGKGALTLKNESQGPQEEEEYIYTPPLTPPLYAQKLGANRRELELAYLDAVRQGGVNAASCPRYAKELAAEGPEYLPHLLGIIAYANSPECTSWPGSVVCANLKERYPAVKRFLPPPEYTFAQALAWAMAGGPRKEERAPLEAPEATAAEPPAELTPAERAWQTALGQLQLELNRNVYNTWLKDTKALPPADDGVFTVGVTHAYAKDWLENRLLDTIQRALGGGAVRFVVLGKA